MEEEYVLKDGTLYHAGVKGMKWGKHLPGTDWWKDKVDEYNRKNAKVTWTFPLTSHTTYPNQAKAYAYAFKEAAKTYGGYIKDNTKELSKDVVKKGKKAFNNIKKGTSKFWNKSKGYTDKKITEFKESAKNSYKSVKKQVHDLFQKYYESSRNKYKKNELDKFLTPTIAYSDALLDYAKSEYGDATKAYISAKINSSVGKDIDLFIQTAQFNFTYGVSEYLRKIGMDQPVRKFLDKLKIKK